MITSATIFTIKPTTGPTRKIFGSFCSHLRDRYISFTRELSLQGNKADAERGSSPLTRGTQKVSQSELARRRFIPAYAGNSYRVHHAQKMRSVHPSLRGELATDTVSVTVTGGSSPLTRGTQQETFGARQRPRFIPAYAGNSNSLISFEVNMTVHPRLRGELT